MIFRNTWLCLIKNRIHSVSLIIIEIMMNSEYDSYDTLLIGCMQINKRTYKLLCCVA